MVAIGSDIQFVGSVLVVSQRVALHDFFYPAEVGRQLRTDNALIQRFIQL